MPKASKAKVIVKSLSWALVSGIIIGSTVYAETYNLRAAFVSALVSALIKTPVYSVHEVVFDRLWNRKRKDKPQERPPLKIAA